MYKLLVVLGLVILVRIVWRHLGRTDPRDRVIQFVTGAVVGAALAVISDEAIASPRAFLWIGGTALVGGALSVWLGPRFWSRLAGAGAETPP